MKEQYLQTAFHESGHILMTYYAGYSCEEVQILESGDGYTITNYGQDLSLAIAINSYPEQPSIFNKLPLDIKRQTSDVGIKTFLIVVSGPVAESLYLNNGVIAEQSMNVEMSGPDLIKATSIHNLLSQLYKNHPQNFMVDTMSNVFAILGDKLIWNSISSLAHAIIDKKDMKLSSFEIEKILEETGFSETLEQDN